jgi:hypothetical protein
MNSVEALTNRPTSDPSENGIMEGTGLPPGPGQRKWETRAHLLHHGLRHLRFLPAGACRLASPDEIVPWETAPAVEPAAYVAQARSVVLLALALRETA